MVGGLSRSRAGNRKELSSASLFLLYWREKNLDHLPTMRDGHGPTLITELKNFPYPEDMCSLLAGPRFPCLSSASVVPTPVGGEVSTVIAPRTHALGMYMRKRHFISNSWWRLPTSPARVSLLWSFSHSNSFLSYLRVNGSRMMRHTSFHPWSIPGVGQQSNIHLGS